MGTFWNEEVVNVGGVSANDVIEVRLVQPSKQKPFIVVTVAGMVRLVRLEQFLKAAMLMEVKPSPSTTLVILEQDPNA